MKTQLSILVTSGMWKMSWKAYIGLWIDKEPQKKSKDFIKLKPSKKPYLIDVEPGEHDFWFVDSSSKDWGLMRGVAKGGLLGGLTGVAAGGLTGYIAGTAAGSIAGGTAENNLVIQDNFMHLNLKEGDIFKIQVTCGGDRNGNVKIKEINE